MSPDEAALCLRDIPDFASYSEAEQREEAMSLLGHDDPLDIALAIEGALMPRPPRETVAAMGDMEPCRLGADCGGSEPIAGNGRCLTCGAYRPPKEAQERVEPLPATQLASGPVSRASEARVETVRASRPDCVGLIERFKAVTGERDTVIGALIGLSRATVSAYATGRLPERLDQQQLRALYENLCVRAEQILRLGGYLDGMISKTD